MCVPDETLTELFELCNIITGIIKGEKKSKYIYFIYIIYREISISVTCTTESKSFSKQENMHFCYLLTEHCVYFNKATNRIARHKCDKFTSGCPEKPYFTNDLIACKCIVK